MRPSFYDNKEYRKKQAERTKFLWKIGKYDFKIKNEIRLCQNPSCKKSFSVKPHDKNKYCSQSCAAKISNTQRPKSERFCIRCNSLLGRSGVKYCSNQCQRDYEYNRVISIWKQGLDYGTRGIKTRTLSVSIRRYLFEKYKSQCALCGWRQKNPTTGKIPLEVDHKDGNAENNSEGNLWLICPNCHSLTSNFRNLNRGKGRKWRMAKYIKVS